VDFNARWITAYRNYVLAVSRSESGTFQILRVPDTWGAFYELTASLYGGVHPDYGSLYTVHDSQIVFSPGYFVKPDGDLELDILAFNGSLLSHYARISHAPNTGTTGAPTSAGLFVWRGELVYYALAGASQQIFKIVKDGQVIDLPDLAASVSGLTSPIAASLGGEIVATADDGSEGVHHLGAGSLSDGYYVSSRLDFDLPGEQKRLNHITVLLDRAASDFKIVVKYRTDDNTSWTTATTANNTTRAAATNLDVAFYTLQLRVDLDDDTGNDEDIRITTVSVTYTAGR
jgi:hypothetical protein